MANPATDWAELESRQDDGARARLAKGELKAMIERKRRNDFVRKREFDMLRKVRREGLSREQLAALGGSSRIDDSEAAHRRQPGARQPTPASRPRSTRSSSRWSATSYAASRRAARPSSTTRRPQPAPVDRDGRAGPPPHRRPAPGATPGGRRPLSSDFVAAGTARRPPPAAAAPARGAAPRPAALRADLASACRRARRSDFGQRVRGRGQRGRPRPRARRGGDRLRQRRLRAVRAVAVGADRPGGARAQHAETWLVLFDLYRATGQQHKFESLALDYAQQFGWSAPQWFSLPKLVAEAAARGAAEQRAAVDGQVGWVCPELLDTDAVAQAALADAADAAALGLRLGRAARRSTPRPAAQLSELFRSWIAQTLDMRWLVGRAPASPCCRTPRRPACATPTRRTGCCASTRCAWPTGPTSSTRRRSTTASPTRSRRRRGSAAQCEVRISGSGAAHAVAAAVDGQRGLDQLRRVAASPTTPRPASQVATVELSGQLVGDIGATLTQAGHASWPRRRSSTSSCARLIRVDFIAAGDLLNWVLAKRSENRSRHLRRGAPAGGAVLRRDGHQRARQGAGCAQSEAGAARGAG